MLEWIFSNAAELKDLLGLIVIAAPIVAWGVRKIMISTKQLASMIRVNEAVLESNKNLAKAVDDIRGQLRPNGGTSLFDMISENNRQTSQNATNIAKLSDRVAEVRAYQVQASEVLAVGPVWHADVSGEWTRVNFDLVKVTERTPAELTGAGWENLVAPADRARVVAEWFDAVKKRRAFECDFTVQSKSGKRFHAHAVATPIVRDGGELVGYLGRLSEIQGT